jgi:hypothetical protein
MSGKRGGGGFWEGGKGVKFISSVVILKSFTLHLMVIHELRLLIPRQTRDRVKMSRKDKRKFRRPGGASKVKD